MDYQAVYNRICVRGASRASTTNKVVAKKFLGYYVERHRILPGSEGGSYIVDNIAWLTRKEHRLAHLLLAKLRPTRENVFAAARMGTKQNWLKQLTSEHQKGKKLSDETRARMSLSKKGKASPTKGMRGRWKREQKFGSDNPSYGRTHSTETKSLLSEKKTKSWIVHYDDGSVATYRGVSDIGLPEGTVRYLIRSGKASPKHKIGKIVHG